MVGNAGKGLQENPIKNVDEMRSRILAARGERNQCVIDVALWQSSRGAPTRPTRGCEEAKGKYMYFEHRLATCLDR